MKGTVIKIDELKWHRDGIYEYYPITFRLEDRRIVFLHLIPSYSNYQAWSFILESGVKTVLDNLQLVEFNQKFINKDCYPTLVSKPEQSKQESLL